MRILRKILGKNVEVEFSNLKNERKYSRRIDFCSHEVVLWYSRAKNTTEIDKMQRKIDEGLQVQQDSSLQNREADSSIQQADSYVERAKLSLEHVRALNTQFANWVQSQPAVLSSVGLGRYTTSQQEALLSGGMYEEVRRGGGILAHLTTNILAKQGVINKEMVQALLGVPVKAQPAQARIEKEEHSKMELALEEGHVIEVLLSVL
ncbi:hypothetical protein KSP40_PGU001693 [Platanthera guangdongensis]|uniref:Uncharacterized protein n=1 Tax=Platanthera guangdongensis TaxID=2320717 RepID=A0ABR2LW40_9ASPA